MVTVKAAEDYRAVVGLPADSVERAKPSAGLVELRDAKSSGLALRITPTGAKSWTLRCRLPSGVQRRISLGKYPGVSLAKARDRALATLAAVLTTRTPLSTRSPSGHERNTLGLPLRQQAFSARSATASKVRF
jgi:hypothetical protein